MSRYLFKSINTSVFLIIVISVFLLSPSFVYAQANVPNQLNIKISEDIVKEGNAEDFISFLSSELKEDLKYKGEISEVRIIKMFSEQDPESQLSRWYKIRFVSEISLDLDDILKKLLEDYEHIVHVEKEYITKSRLVPNDFVIGQLSYDYYALIGAYEAWDMEKGREDVIVAVIDSGVDVNHPDLANRFVDQSLFKRYDPDTSIDKNNPTEECYLYKGEIYCFDIYIDSKELDNGVVPPWYDVRDVVPHGTPIAGIIAANHNTIGVPGICPRCKLLPIKTSYLEHLVEQNGQISPFTEGTSTTGTVSSAIEYAAKNGADVINLSMSTSKDATVLRETVNEISERYNSILIAPSDNDDEEGKAYPAAYDNVIGLTAVKVNSQNRIVKRTNSQYGTWLDVVAPGDNILSLMLNSNNLKAYSGTSLATPFVTGLAALVRSRDSNFTIHNFRQLLRESSTRIDDPLYDEKKLGYGLINLKMALDILDDHPWDYGSITQQGYTSSSGGSGGNSLWPGNTYYVNPYLTGSSFYPYGSFGGYGGPTYISYPTLFGSTFSPYFQQPSYSRSYIIPVQFNQSSSYSPYVVSPFSQFNPVFQRYSPYFGGYSGYGGFGGFNMFSPFMGGFGGSPFVVFSFPYYR